MKKLFLILICLIIVFMPVITAFAEEDTTLDNGIMPFDNEDKTQDEKDYSHLRGTVVNVYNWGEYIADGKYGSLDINKAFEEKYGITVKYTNYDSNEVMYGKLKGGGANYDVVIPSDYMIERMIDEDMLESLDFSNIPNYKYIVDEFKGLFFDPYDKYSVPYTYGMVGLIYNTTMVDGTPDSWSLMWDEQYTGKILMFNNARDAFGVAQFLLGQDANTTNADDWQAAFEKLKEQKPLIQSYVMDEVFSKMETGEAAIAPYYAGDFLTMQENNGDLAFVYPKEGTNIFVDSMCIPKGAPNKEAAELYINFMLDPEIALENAEYICYASPNTAVLENEEYSLKDNEILYPPADMRLETQYFHNLPQDTLTLMTDLFNDLKIEGGSYTGVYIALAVAVVLIIVFFVYSGVKKKRRG